jgi:hypothetical protein
MSQATRVYRLSRSLQGLLGKSELSRPAAVKELYVCCRSCERAARSRPWKRSLTELLTVSLPFSAGCT